ncbi:SIS domain-containing protein [Acidobacteriota bacterium]
MKVFAKRSEAIQKKIHAIKEQTKEVIDSFFNQKTESVIEVARVMADAVSRGSKILLFGNGGSAADAQHIASEFVNRLSRNRPALAAVALTVDTSVLTSIANDCGFEKVFSRQIEAIGSKGDMAVAISTSGESENIIKGIEAARAKGMIVVGLLGRDGGKAAAMADHALIVSHQKTQRIQEIHIMIGHMLAELVEDMVYPEAETPAKGEGVSNE